MKTTMGNILVLSSKLPPIKCGIGDYSVILKDRLLSVGFNVTTLSYKNEKDSVDINTKTGYQIKRRNVWGALKIVNLVRADWLVIQYEPSLFGRYGLCGYLILMIALLKFKNVKVLIMFHEVRGKISIKSLKSIVKGFNEYVCCKTLYWMSDKQLTSNLLYRNLLGGDSEIIRIPSNFELLKSPAVKLEDKDSNFVIGLFSPKKYALLFLIKYSERILSLDKRIVIIIIGDNYDHIKQMIADEKLSSLSERIILTGRLNAKQIFQKFTFLDLFLSLDGQNGKSSWSGTSSKSGTLSTALYHGIPTIGIEGELTDMLFKHKVNIFLVKEEGEILGAIKLLIRDVSLRQLISSKSRQLYDENFSWSQSLSVYKHILSS
jgi:glycosyltransferase involved in cell wall biosynthesis